MGTENSQYAARLTLRSGRELEEEFERRMRRSLLGEVLAATKVSGDIEFTYLL